MLTKLSSQSAKNWESGDLKGKYLVQDQTHLRPSLVLKYITTFSKLEVKKVKNEVRTFNRLNGWKKTPLSVSTPAYSQDQKHAIIALQYGNEGGEYRLYEKVLSEWKFVTVLAQWAY